MYSYMYTYSNIGSPSMTTLLEIMKRKDRLGCLASKNVNCLYFNRFERQTNFYATPVQVKIESNLNKEKKNLTGFFDELKSAS